METMRGKRTGSWLVAIVVAAAVAACGGGSEQAAGGEGEDSGGAEEASTASMQAPDTTASSLWSHLQEADYRRSWQLWPEKGELYSGGEPHGMLLTTYLNGTAFDALTGSAGSLPAGAIVVKENFMPDSTLAAVTVMFKSDDYDAEHNDWFWVKYDPDGSVANDGMASGRVPGCIQCHGGAADNDYIMTGPVGGGN